MAAIPNAPLVSVEEYIARFVEGGEKPICEYLDGVLIPKSMGTKRHSQVQANITYLIRNRYGEQLNPLPELTTRIRETQFYVPDVAIEELARPIQGRYPGPNNPVLLCVEIVSPPDRVGKLFGKCEEYHKWGVPHCWVIDPERK
ncbi:MAG: Uma2 family endonuclease, partial [Acidobacteriaceae bacterium]|nr:Uma2 family endonuclease [Acidobacteriaceae bacterium]